MRLRHFAPLAAAVAIAPVAQADGLDFTLAGGYAFAGTEGWELELGGQYDLGDRVFIRLSPANVVFFEGDPPEGFYTDTFSNGQERCRNSRNGQFADDENCMSEGDMEWRGTAELQVRLSKNILIGGGGLYTFTSDDIEKEGTWAGFGSLRWEASRKLGVDLRVGADYAGIMLRLTS